ncbi:hypothetical protein QYS49_32810 [Marivirga salinae]|uniref:Uncharacterized protein n=1 Tax=Marivirga salinarum TaxID=3059078 RepID=A0AA51NE14_9BACT|nr:hypothetical protein [Marivirga sp. BDSF4-3]WMN12205.1 hypothetical protein QYS49_32810 [Marivirga sp. BDSF4-3]
MKRYSIILFAISLISTIDLKAQDKPAALIKGESATVSENLIKFEIGSPNGIGISYEKKLGHHISLYNIIGLRVFGGGGTTSQAIYGVSPWYVLTPQISVQPRFYHNLDKRAAMDKNINYNSANYVGFTARFYHQSFFYSNSDRIGNSPAVLDLMLSYGLQRSFFKRLNFDLAIQPGIEFTSWQPTFFLGLNLQLGFIVFSN